MRESLTEQVTGLDALELPAAPRGAGRLVSGRTPGPKPLPLCWACSCGRQWSGRVEAGLCAPRPPHGVAGVVAQPHGRQPAEPHRASRCAAPWSATASPCWWARRSAAWWHESGAAYRGGIADHRPADHALDRLVPAGHRALQAVPSRRSCS